MYIGDVGFNGLHQLIFQVLDNSVDQALAGHCDLISITLHKDNSVTVKDNGRGIPIDIHKELNIPAVQVVMTTLHAGGKFDNDSYSVSGGLHGVGVSVVNALSSKLDVVIHKDKKKYKQTYEKGLPITKLQTCGRTKQTGTTITFTPDFGIFEQVQSFDSYYLINRLKQIAYLNRNIKILFYDERNDTNLQFDYKDGIVEFVKQLIIDKSMMFQPIYLNGTQGDVWYQIALSYSDTQEQNIRGYVNNIKTVNGGTHVSGFKNGFTTFINSFIKDNNLLRGKEKNLSISGNDIRQGMTCVVSIRIPNPQFEGQTKSKLNNTYVEKIISQAVTAFFNNSDIKVKLKLKSAINHILSTVKLKQSLKQMKQATKKPTNNVLQVSKTLPIKLADCILKNNTSTQLFLVQGDSAGGSSKQGRDRKYQAILPLSGKITNVQKLSFKDVIENEKVKPILTALGISIGEQIDIKSVRYGKVVIMTDADVDGAHIKILLLTLFYRYLRPLIQNQMIYIANPPLFVITSKNKKIYAYSQGQKQSIISKLSGKYMVQRFKGLGQMNPSELWETTMNPKKRKLTLVTMDDVVQTDKIMCSLMGDDVLIRKSIIDQNFQSQNLNLDI